MKLCDSHWKHHLIGMLSHILKLLVRIIFLFLDTFLKQSFSKIRVGPSVRPRRIAFFVNFSMLELSYQFQTLHGDICSSSVLRFRKRRNCIVITWMSILNMLIFIFLQQIFMWSNYPIVLIFGILTHTWDNEVQYYKQSKATL